MSLTLYEQFFAVGSVKSLLTGKEQEAPRLKRKTPEQPAASQEKLSLEEKHPRS